VNDTAAPAETVLGEFLADPTSTAAIDRVFRAAHTIKGCAGCLELHTVGAAAAAVEEVLDALRSTPGDPAGALDGLADRIDDLGRALDRLFVDRNAAHEAPAPTDDSIRIDLGMLDEIGRLVGDLERAARAADLAALGADVLGIADRLQSALTSARRRPLAELFDRLPAVVEGLAARTGKLADLRTSGGDVCVDRRAWEALSGPIAHLLRNCVDHGIESPGDRRAAGKPDRGVVRIDAELAGGDLRLTIADDGRGFDRDRIAECAIARGLTDHVAASTMETADLLEFIFQPGFSTADRVTDLSGRGVGMDVVRACVDRLGGSVRVRSDPGRGATFELTIPAA